LGKKGGGGGGGGGGNQGSGAEESMLSAPLLVTNTYELQGRPSLKCI